MSFLKAASQNEQNSSGAVFKPQLTSLVDVMVILLVFLIKSFSVEGSLIPVPESVALPLSTSETPVEQIRNIEVTNSGIVVGEKMLVTHKEYTDADSLLVKPLYGWLEEQELTENDRIMLQSDRDIEFNIIKRVMYTCSRAGITDFKVLVIQEG